MQDISIYGLDRSRVDRKVLVDPTGRMGRSYHMRDITTTASSTVTRNDETEIMTGVASTFLDITMVSLSNTSTNAINLQIRSGRGASIADTYTAAASGVTRILYDPPYPATEAGAAWTMATTNVAADSGDSPVTATIIAVNNTNS